MNLNEVFIFLIIVIPVFYIINADSYQECEVLKSGIFVSIDSIAGKTVIYRKDSAQVEENETLRIRYFQKLKWIDECSYQIYSVKILKNDKKLTIPPGNFTITLKKVNDSTYIQNVLIESMNFNYQSEVVKIEDDIDGEYLKILTKEN